MPQFVPGGTFSFLPDWLRTLSESQYSDIVAVISPLFRWNPGCWCRGLQWTDSLTPGCSEPSWEHSAHLSFPGFMCLSMAPQPAEPSHRGCLCLRVRAWAMLQPACTSPCQLPVSDRLYTRPAQVSFRTLLRSRVLLLSLPSNLLMISPLLRYLLKPFHFIKGVVMKPDEELLT